METDALLLALRACGVEPEIEVITTPFTFIATAEVIRHLKATPVFVDICPIFQPDCNQISDKITSKQGQLSGAFIRPSSATWNPSLKIAEKYNLKLSKIARQAFGARYNGRKVGTIGDAGCFSFFPSKIWPVIGDGGIWSSTKAKSSQNK